MARSDTKGSRSSAGGGGHCGGVVSVVGSVLTAPFRLVAWIGRTLAAPFRAFAEYRDRRRETKAAKAARRAADAFSRMSRFDQEQVTRTRARFD